MTAYQLGLLTLLTLILAVFAVARVFFNPWDVLYALGILTAVLISLYFRFNQRRNPS